MDCCDCRAPGSKNLWVVSSLVHVRAVTAIGLAVSEYLVGVSGGVQALRAGGAGEIIELSTTL